ncbi:hypothetical protein AJ80_04100 [Polytolypa hystricis UAMH7299]|uniref:Uncharacterized protein n=1 Tax=Polytolypa hystricis (strain UAMH7299) TaxID=1447883 RepID=A0A2B7YD91_POLH7|nr:hypothetical protein AJ80_04100 [Polytolypa hystricis UAMH7299]
MSQLTPGLSRTLPKDFTFGTGEPKTPERPTVELKMPPPPRHSSCRFRRPTIDIFANHEGGELNPFSSADVPLPSIEFPQEPTAALSQIFQINEPETTVDGHLVVPARERVMLKTPPAQIREISGEGESNWNHGSAAEFGNAIDRPSSSCSHISDSSVSSCASYNSYPSFGGSCTSPESEIQDPFVAYAPSAPKHLAESPSITVKARGRSINLPAAPKWTAEMDNHLWNTYQLYLQDPTLTPFKMVPGSLPPLGVSHRVARQARKTWSRAKRIVSRKGDSRKTTSSTAQQLGELGESMEKPGVDLGTRSGSATPTAKVVNPKPLWPKSDASTRRRLKGLCKRKFSIAPHYQRLLQSRSPSPFPDPVSAHTSSMSARLGIPYANTTSFATRDLGVSLVSSSMPGSMIQAGGGADTVHVPRDNWFNNIAEPRQSIPQVWETSLQHSGITGVANPGPIPRLGSPFMYNTWGPDSSRQHLRHTAPLHHHDTIHAIGSRLRSPVYLDSFSSSHKRRALSELEEEAKPNGGAPYPSITNLLRDETWKDLGQRRVRTRNRGATMGALSSRERLNQLFSPPPFLRSSNDINQRPSTSQTPGEHNTLLPPPEDIKRLGSPFDLDKMTGNAVRYHAPRHAPSLSDPFIARPATSYMSMGAQSGAPSNQPNHNGLSPFSVSGEPIIRAEYSGKRDHNTPSS